MLRVLNPGGTLLLGRIALVAALAVVSSSWTCNAMFVFHGCEGTIPQPQISSLSPDPIVSDMESVLLTVNGSGFAPQSQIMWNGSALPTTFVDIHLLQTTITQQTFASLGGTSGSTVEISVVSSPGSAVSGCPNGGSSAGVVLVIH